MGSDLYRVTVAKKQDRTATLRLEVVHPDSNYFSDNESFALMLLHEGTRDTSNPPLASELSFDDLLDRGFMQKYTRGFVERVEKTIESGSSEGQTKAEWLKGTLAITVTDPVWISHLAVGAAFDSRAYEVAFELDDCPAIRPGQVDPNAKPPPAFIAAPGALWEGSGLPAVVRVAAYSASAYRSPKLRKGTFQAADLKDLDGQVVVYQGEYDQSLQVGTLTLQDETIRIHYASDGGSGGSSTSSFEGSIGLAELIPGKRLGTRLKASSFLRSLKPELRSASIEGDSATFRIALPPGNETFANLSDEQQPSLGFHLLVAPLLPIDRPIPTVFTPSPLSWTLEREVLARFPAEQRQAAQYIDEKMVPIGDSMPGESDLSVKLARAIVAKTEVVSGAAVPAGELDQLDEAGQRTVLSAAWPELVVKVTPTHAVYLQHLSAKFGPLGLPQWIGEAEAWTEAIPAPATAATGFGLYKTAAKVQSSGGGSSSPAGSNKALKIVGIGCGVIVALFLCCLVLGALVGGK